MACKIRDDRHSATVKDIAVGEKACAVGDNCQATLLIGALFG